MTKLSICVLSYGHLDMRARSTREYTVTGPLQSHARPARPARPATSHLPPPQPFNDSKDRHRPRSPATKTKHGNSFSASSPCRRFSKEYCTDFLAALKMSPAFASKLPYTTPAIKHIRYDSLLRLSYTHRHIECVRASLSLAEADDM